MPLPMLLIYTNAYRPLVLERVPKYAPENALNDAPSYGPKSTISKKKKKK